MMLLVGEPLQKAASGLIAGISSRPVERSAPLLCAASAVQQGVVLRLAGEDAESVSHELKHQLQFCAELLGDNPWSRKW